MRRTTTSHSWLLAAALAWGCNDATGTGAQPAIDASVPDAGTPDTGEADTGESENPDAGDDCTPVPDHDQLLNAPSGAEKVDVQPVLPLRNADGTLPDLP